MSSAGITRMVSMARKELSTTQKVTSGSTRRANQTTSLHDATTTMEHSQSSNNSASARKSRDQTSSTNEIDNMALDGRRVTHDWTSVYAAASSVSLSDFIHAEPGSRDASRRELITGALQALESGS